MRPTRIAAARVETSLRMTRAAWLRLAAVLTFAALLRLPGVGWGFHIEEGRFFSVHADEHVCTSGMRRGVSFLDGQGDRFERGVEVPCIALGWALRAAGYQFEEGGAVFVARLASVGAGLALIVVIYLLTGLFGGNEAQRLIAAFFVATAGVSIATSFWARGQIQACLLFYASVAAAVRSRREDSGTLWLFIAAACAGAGLATRFTIALVPMLALACCFRASTSRAVLAVAAGIVAGFAGLTAGYWTPVRFWTWAVEQHHLMVAVKGPLVPWPTTTAAVLLGIVAGAGAATSACAAGQVVSVLARLRSHSRSRLTLRAALSSPVTLLLVAVGAQLALLTRVQLFDARYVDSCIPAVAVLAAPFAARLAARRATLGIFALVVAYQCVYAVGVVRRFVDDPRERLAADVEKVIPPNSEVHVGAYIPDTSSVRRIANYQKIEQADWVIVNELGAARYWTRRGTFVGLPRSCREVWACGSEAHLRAVQSLRDPKRWRRVKTYRVATWTPELRWMRKLMTSKWLFTGDVIVYERVVPRERDEAHGR
jgi:hypothetical protein